MRIATFLLFVAFIILLFAFACKKELNEQRFEDKGNQAENTLKRSDRSTSSYDTDLPRFHYDDLGILDESEIRDINHELFESISGLWLAWMYSRSAHLCFYFYGFYPQSIEELYSLGLVPYEVPAQSRQYELIRRSLSVVLSPIPGSPKPDAGDQVRFREKVDFATADPNTLMEFKKQVLRRSYGACTSHYPAITGEKGFSISAQHLLLPGVEDIVEGSFQNPEWSLNAKFFTNPYTGKPMKQVPWDSPSPGDFAVRYNDGDYYEVAFFTE